MAMTEPPPRRQGQALVEMALILPIMLLILLATIDFGRAYYAGVAMTGAAREGARYASTSRCVQGGGCSDQDATVRALVRSAIGAHNPALDTSAALNACPTNPPADTAKPCVVVEGFAPNGSASGTRPEGYSVRVRVFANVVMYTSVLAEGVHGVVPGLGLCYDSGLGRVCRVPVVGEAYMVVM
jgi:Flp pilus assembly protein TadG